MSPKWLPSHSDTADQTVAIFSPRLCRSPRLENSQTSDMPAESGDRRRAASGASTMKKLLTAFVIAIFVAPLGAQQPTAKKPISHDVYDGWKSIQGTRVSRDGIWVAYALTPHDGDGELGGSCA